MANSEKLKTFILRWEGGYCNDPNDLGHETNKGITLATYRSVYGQSKTVEDLKRMTDEEWMTIFKRYYWDKWHADDIKSQSVANILVDWVWASGAYGIKIPQRVLGVAVDGIVGSKTLEAVNSRDSLALFNLIKKERKEFIDRICQTRSQNRKFKKGWLNRLNDITYND